jgi:hypothetical protein
VSLQAASGRPRRKAVVTDAEFEPLRRHFTIPQTVELAATPMEPA